MNSTSDPANGTGESRRFTIGLYVIAVFLYWVALYLYVPTLPVYIQTKTNDLALVGVVLSMYGLWQLITRLPLGIAADWLGWRKPFIIVGFALTGLGAWLLGAAGGAEGLIVGRATAGLGAATWVPLLVAFSALFPPKEAVRASAILTLVSSIGRFIAMAATGPLNEWGGYSPAYYLAAGAAALALLVILVSPEKRRPARRPSPRQVGRLVVRKDVLLPALLNAVGQIAEWSVIFGFLPILAQQLGAGNVTQSLLMSAFIGVLTVGNLTATTIVARLGAKRMVYLGFVLLTAGIAVAALAPSILVLSLAYVLIGVALGINYPILMGLSIRDVPDAERTTAMGLHQAVYAIGMFTGPWLSGILAEAIGIRPTFGITAFLCLSLGLLGTHWLSARAETKPDAAGRAAPLGHEEPAA